MSGCERAIDRFPYVPDRRSELDQDCYEAFNIQVQGLMKRMQVTNGERIVIGVSGGLDSTHALLVAAKTFDGLRLAAQEHPRLHDAGIRDVRGHEVQRVEADEALGVTGEEIDIKPAALQMLEGHRPSVRAGRAGLSTSRSRTCRRDCAPTTCSASPTSARRSCSAPAILSELALGWCTYGVGDHMSHYNVNGSVPKTLIQYLVRWVVKTKQLEAAASATLLSILEHRDLAGARARRGRCGNLQSTQSKVGPYELQDFQPVLHHALRPAAVEGRVPRVACMARCARGPWPPNFPDEAKHAYTLADIKKWLRHLPVSVLRDQPVQALGVAERAKGAGGRQPVAARRLARAVGRQRARVAG